MYYVDNNVTLILNINGNNENNTLRTDLQTYGYSSIYSTVISKPNSLYDFKMFERNYSYFPIESISKADNKPIKVNNADHFIWEISHNSQISWKRSSRKRA